MIVINRSRHGDGRDQCTISNVARWVSVPGGITRLVDHDSSIQPAWTCEMGAEKGHRNALLSTSLLICVKKIHILY